MVQNLILNYSPKHVTLKKQLKYWIQLVLKSKHYPSALIIHLLVLLLMIRHRFPASFPKWTSLLSLLLVRTTLKRVGLSCLPSPIKQQALTKGKALTTRDRTTVSRLSFRPDGSYLTRKAVLCSKYVHFISIHETLPAPSSCSTHTNVIQLSKLMYDNKLKHNGCF